jgi:3-isopropylmalate/(R)-2-methylmalate dehydratase small subunit
VTVAEPRGWLIEGRAWVFGDDVNTDDMYPGFAMRLPVSQAAQLMFNASRPDWPSLVRPGDIVVGGRNFGLGSSRPVAELFKELKVGALVAERFNSLFYRNCINYGLPALTLGDVRAYVAEGDRLQLDIGQARLTNTRTGAEYQASPLPAFLQAILAAGGLVPQLTTAGLIRTREAARQP